VVGEPSLELALTVRGLIAPHIRRTPLLRSEALSRFAGGEVFLKCENLQFTGSFKLRGALAALAMLPDESRRKGVYTCSAGNHGLGLARAAGVFGVPCTVILPASAPRVKEEGIRAEGARVVRSPFEGYDDAEAWMRERAGAWGETFVSAFDDPAVIVGNGATVMLEILEDLPDPDWVVLPCGGGGLSGGAGLVIRELCPHTRAVGVNTEASPGMWLSWRDGRAHERVDSAPTIAEGLEGGVSERTYRLSRRVLDDLWTVPESALGRAVGWVAREERMIVEGSGAAAIAAIREGRPRGGRIVAILSGSNIDPERLRKLLDP